MLDLSRIERGGAAGPSERFDPCQRLHELVPRIAGERAADVRLLVEPGDSLVTDPVACERVAANLILNALRYGAPPVEIRRSGTAGAGVGLAIASAYARALGGELGYEPSQPRGARFTLTLPAARS